MAYTSARRRPGTSSPGDGSRTITITNAQPEEDAAGPSNVEDPIGALHLTGGGAPRRSRPHVAWSEDVVDNEGCGRKSSKICCIYDKPRRFDESSDEDSSDSDSDSDIDDGRARRSRSHQHSHSHDHPHRPVDGDAGGVLRDPQSSSVTQLEQPSEPNAYERGPYGKKGKGKKRSE